MSRNVVRGVVFALILGFIAGSASAQFLYEAANNSGTINTFTSSGVRSTFASGLHYPGVLAFDTAGNLFEGDGLTGNIYKFSYNNEILNPTPSLYAPSTGINSQLEGLALDNTENLFEVYANGAVLKIAPGGSQTTLASGLNVPVGAAVDSGGNLFVAVQNDNAIIKITPGGVRSTFATSANGVNTPNGLAFDKAGNLFAASYYGGTILKLTPSGSASTVGPNLGYGLTYLAVDGSGDVFVSDSQTSQIDEVTAGGVESTFASGVIGLGLAIEPVPEPSALALAALVSGIFLLWRFRGRVSASR